MKPTIVWPYLTRKQFHTSWKLDVIHKPGILISKHTIYKYDSVVFIKDLGMENHYILLENF